MTCKAEGLPAWVADLDYGRRAVLLAGVGIFLPWRDEGAVGFAVLIFAV